MFSFESFSFGTKTRFIDCNLELLMFVDIYYIMFQWQYIIQFINNIRERKGGGMILLMIRIMSRYHIFYENIKFIIFLVDKF